MRWDEEPARPRTRFAASAGSVEGYGGRGVDGIVFHPSAGLLFRDSVGDTWWIVFQPLEGSDVHGDQALGDILACSASYDETIQVRVLASGVRFADGRAAFRQARPFRYEEAVEVARRITSVRR